MIKSQFIVCFIFVYEVRAYLERLQNSLFEKINNQCSLKITDFSDYHNVRSWSSDCFKGEIAWWDEIKGSKLTGVSKFNYECENSREKVYTINAWMGPTLLVPNLLLTISQTPDDGNCLTMV